MSEFDGVHASEADARLADSLSVGAGTPETAPWELPEPAIAEPVRIGGFAGAVISAAVGLLAFDLTPLQALVIAAVLVAVTEWQRSQVTPYR